MLPADYTRWVESVSPPQLAELFHHLHSKLPRQLENGHLLMFADASLAVLPAAAAGMRISNLVVECELSLAPEFWLVLVLHTRQSVSGTPDMETLPNCNALRSGMVRTCTEQRIICVQVRCLSRSCACEHTNPKSTLHCRGDGKPVPG